MRDRVNGPGRTPASKGSFSFLKHSVVLSDRYLVSFKGQILKPSSTYGSVEPVIGRYCTLWHVTFLNNENDEKDILKPIITLHKFRGARYAG